jgi:UDP:flavonoid glycosyltransferase YjiC (YdhE family)
MVLIPTPSHTEQLNNAYRVKEMGLAEILEQKDINRESLVGTIEKMLGDEDYRKRAGEIQIDISGLNGLNNVVETITRVAQTHK